MMIIRKKIYSLIALALLSGLISCTQDDGSAKVAYTLEEKDLIPEGITHDPGTDQFFVSSINKEKIVSITRDGIVSDFAKSRQDSLLETLGMKVDAAARRLWVVSNKSEGKVNWSAVHIYDIDSKNLIKKIIISDTIPCLFNDLILTSRGDAYITDSYGGRIFHADKNPDKLEIFMGPDSLLQWVNGIAISPDDKFLFPASGAQITVIDLSTKIIRPIGDQGMLGSKGIDGIVYYKGSLLAVINEKKDEKEMLIASYKLGSDLMSIVELKIIDKGNPMFNIPTTCVIAGGELYCLANTSLRMYFQDKTNEKGLFQKPLILRYKLGS